MDTKGHLGKITLFTIFLLFHFQFFGRHLDKKISIEMKNKPINEILAFIEEKAQVNFSYNSGLIQFKELKSVQYSNTSLDKILTDIFSDLNIDYKEIEDQIILIKKKPEHKTTSKASVSKPKNIQQENIRYKTRYVYDTIRKLVIDTIVTYNFDTIFYHDTLTILDTLRIIDSVSFYSKPNETNIHKDGLSFELYFAPSVYSTTNIETSSDNNIFMDIEKEWQTVFSFNTGLGLSYNISKFGLSTGITYTNHTEELKFFQELITNNYIDFEIKPYNNFTITPRTITITDTAGYYTYMPGDDDSSWYSATYPKEIVTYDTTTIILHDSIQVEKTDTIQEAYNYDLKREISYISVPLIISYRIDLAPKLSAYFKTGVAFSFLLNYQEHLSNKNFYTTKSELSPIIYSAIAGIELCYRLDETLSILLGASYIHNLNSMYKDSFDITKKLQSLNIKFGIRYSL